MRKCASCRRNLPRSSYSGKQFSKRPGISRCAGCVHGIKNYVPSVDQFDSGRYNDSDSVKIPIHNLENPFSEGTFRWVAKGSYVSGARQGQECVAKFFKTGAIFEADYFILDLKAVEKALQIVSKFNELDIMDQPVKVNVPTVWQIDQSSSKWEGQNVLCEPFIENYQKFNSNTGWTNDAEVWGKAMQALSHFSYDISGGEFVLCDLQGGIYQHEVVLSDPAILSRNHDYGVTDLGFKGISTFFNKHRCNSFCRPYWTQPINRTQYYRANAGTTMKICALPTHHSQAAKTQG